MMKMLGAAAVAVALACAGSAGAATMIANLSGDWNDSPIWESWSVELLYDTSGLTFSQSYGYDSYGWDIADGTPSPLLAAKGTFVGHAYCDWSEPCDFTPIPVSFDLTEFTSFRIDLNEGYRFSLSGGNVTLSQLGVMLFSPSIDISQPFLGSPWPDYGMGSIGDVELGMPHTHGLQVMPSPVPEPATWAMMIAGFGMAGAVMRRRPVRAWA